MEEKFKKNDEGKSPWSKFPWRGAEHVMTIMKHGAEKYGWDNWRKAQTEKDRRRYIDAAMRHLVSHSKGEYIDHDSQELAVAHAACSLLFYLECAGHQDKLFTVAHDAECSMLSMENVPLDSIPCARCRGYTRVHRSINVPQL